MSDERESIMIARIVLDTKDDKQIDLTLDEARILRDKLNELLENRSKSCQIKKNL